MNSIADYKEFVQRELCDLKIGILCLNAGVWVAGPVDLVSDQVFENEIRLLGNGVIYFTKAILP